MYTHMKVFTAQSSAKSQSSTSAPRTACESATVSEEETVSHTSDFLQRFNILNNQQYMNTCSKFNFLPNFFSNSCIYRAKLIIIMIMHITSA